MPLLEAELSVRPDLSSHLGGEKKPLELKHKVGRDGCVNTAGCLVFRGRKLPTCVCDTAALQPMRITAM